MHTIFIRSKRLQRFRVIIFLYQCFSCWLSDACNRDGLRLPVMQCLKFSSSFITSKMKNLQKIAEVVQNNK
jgi:hypothetical protein